MNITTMKKLIITSATTLLLVSAMSHSDNSLESSYMYTHNKHITPFIHNLVDEANTQFGWDAGLVYNKGFTWDQSKSVIQSVKKNMDKCWSTYFLSNATPNEIKTTIKLFKDNNTQFVSQQVPSYKSSLNYCTSKSGEYLKKGMNEIIYGS